MSVTLAVDKEERTGGQSEVMYFIFADGTFVCAYTEANTAINRAEDILRGGKAKNIVLLESNYVEPLEEHTYYKVTLDPDK